MIRGFELVDTKHQRNNGGLIPSRADGGSAGYDLFSPVDFRLMPNDRLLVWLDIKAYMQEDEVLMVYVRSSMGKQGIRLANGTGIIDSSYYGNPDNDGNIGLLLVNDSDYPFTVKRGQAIGQGVFTKFLTADNDLVRSKERVGGFGSSGV